MGGAATVATGATATGATGHYHGQQISLVRGALLLTGVGGALRGGGGAFRVWWDAPPPCQMKLEPALNCRPPHDLAPVSNGG